MSLDSVVVVNISKATKTPSRAGFGTLLLMCYHAVTAKKLALYTSVKGITDDGFPLTHPAVRMAQKAFSQSPAPASVMIGKRAVGTTQVIVFTPANLTAGFHYQFSVIDYLGVVTEIDYVVLGGATAATISTAIVALLGAVASVTAATVSTTGWSLTSTTAGRLFNLTGLPDLDDLAIKNNSADPGIAADLQAIYDIDAATWYGIALDSSSKAEALAAAAWVEATRKILGVNCSDSEVADNTVTNDMFSTLKASTYARTIPLFSQTELLSYSAATWMANRFPYNPGKASWDYVTLAAVTIDLLLKDGQVANIKAKNGNVYIDLAGSGSAENGNTASGEWIDITTGTDWLHARMQERIVGALQAASNSGTKIPYTDKGVMVIVGLVMAQLAEATSVNFNLLSTDPKPTVTAPKVADIDPGSKALRELPDITFTGVYQGAINKLILSGTISL